MQLDSHIQAIREDVANTARIGDEATAEAAQRLSEALGSTLHLRLLDLLGEAALEIGGQLVSGRIEVRLAGRDPELVYVEEEPPEPVQAAAGDDSFSARITLRLPEGLKAQIEVAANIEGTSVNSWIVRALQRGLEPRTRSVRPGRRLSGWADS